MLKIAAFAEKVVESLSTNPARHKFIQVVEPPPVGGAGGGGKLRIVPDYSDESNKGVLIESVVQGAAGAKGGILEGDRIISIAGQLTPNVNAYMAAMQRHRPGTEIEVVVLRKGKEFKLKVTPE
jgi:S1-C subfamily serine protease